MWKRKKEPRERKRARDSIVEYIYMREREYVCVRARERTYA